jgi:hypothetical protein
MMVVAVIAIIIIIIIVIIIIVLRAMAHPTLALVAMVVLCKHEPRAVFIGRRTS